jgi:hypothetical protein
MLIMLAESRHRRCKLSRYPANAGLGVSGHVVNYSDNSHTVSDAQYLGISLWRDGISGNSSSTLSVYQGLYNIGISFIGLPWLPLI